MSLPVNDENQQQRNRLSQFPPLHPILGSFAHELNVSAIRARADESLYPKTSNLIHHDFRRNPNLPYIRHSESTGSSILSLVRSSYATFSLFEFVREDPQQKICGRRNCTSIAEEEVMTKDSDKSVDDAWIVIDDLVDE